MSIIEELRQNAVNRLFQANGFNSVWNTWQSQILSHMNAPNPTPNQIFDLGDHLSSIFQSTNTAGRTQATLSGGGAAWESLICWYLNLCLVGRRTVVIKHNKHLIPEAVRDAITVNYNNFVSNTESDLVAITFPDNPEYSLPSTNILNVQDQNGLIVPSTVGRHNPRPNTKGLLDALVRRDFNEIEIHIIQCKTNWNDNAQIPMLWNMIYSAQSFRRGSGISVGRGGYSITNIAEFSYSFVTVPSQQGTPAATATQVMRVRNLTGGNYWGRPSITGVAFSVKEMLTRNLNSGQQQSILSTLNMYLPNLRTSLSYFQI